MVKTLHDNCFYFPDGSIKPYFKMNKPQINEIIIQHPYLGFDPQNYKIYREKYSIDFSIKNLFKKFINLFEKNAKIHEDEIHFYDTGYWSILDKDYLYIGSGEKELTESIKKISSGKFAFCLSNRDLILFFKGSIDNNRIKNSIGCDIYCTNYFLPYVEILTPVRKTLNDLGETNIQIKEHMDFSQIYVNSKRGEKLDINYVSNYLKNKKNIMIPYAVIPIGRWVGPVVVPNDFKPFPIKSLDSIEYIIGQFPGGCLKHDFFTPGKFYYSCFIGNFSDVIILDGAFHKDIFSEKKKLTAINDSGIDKKYLDYFTK